ncbi:MAG TPA: MmgE/PrpD family protein [Limnochordales bacterium]
MNNPVTARVARFIVEADPGRLPEELHETARRLIYDNLAVAVAGSRSPAGRIVQEHIRQLGATGHAAVLGTSLRAPASLAALANGTAAHADDYDDTQIASLPDRVTGLLTHPTTPVLSAALACALTSGATGQQLLEAYEVGVEVACKLAEAIHPQHYQKGFHSTGTLGAFGAFAAAARLLQLDEAQVVRGLGIVASLASGLRGNFGTMTKPLHAGRAAENGVVAAQLARRGFTATPDVLDSEWGFFAIMGGGFDREYLEQRLGNPFQLQHPGVAIKPYPCGSLAHPTMDAVRDLVLTHDVRPEQVERVEVGVTRYIRQPLRYQRPQTELQAKFSLEFAVAIMVLERQAGIHQYTDEVVQSARVQEFLERVHVYVDPAMEARGYDKMHSVVRILLKDGRRLEQEAQLARGYPQRPFTREDHLAKFEECARGVLPAGSAQRVWEKVMALPRLRDLQELVSLLVA